MNKPPTRKIIQTDDGSSSIYNEQLKETYHSTHGALQESRHVFIDAGLKKCICSPARILEVGFGTGLNVLLSMEYAIAKTHPVEMVTLESEPLEKDLIDALNYDEQLGDQRASDWFSWLHEQDWDVKATFHSLFTLEKKRVNWLTFDPDKDWYDIVFYDAFAPSRQPEMWEFACIKKACNSLKKGGCFVTYSASGQLKRNLKQAGMEVETLPGPPGKKEMVRAVKM
jgi:tRNA U34 5-methylaminomethyl-2-thiouridine-forming methyltransferase MnmC